MRIERTKDGIRFIVKVQPKVSKSGIAGTQGEYLKVKVTAPPVQGKANKECLKILAEWLGVKTSQVEIEKGGTSRIKKVKIKGDTQELIKRFREI